MKSTKTAAMDTPTSSSAIQTRTQPSVTAIGQGFQTPAVKKHIKKQASVTATGQADQSSAIENHIEVDS